MKKFKLTKETIEFCGTILYRIEALKNFGNVKVGDKGGFVQSENNLSHGDNAWVYDDALVFGKAWVFDDACVCDNAWVSGNALVCDDARVCDNSHICGNAMICDNARVCGNAVICDTSHICGNTVICNSVDIIQVDPIEGRYDFTTFFKNKDDEISVR